VNAEPQPLPYSALQPEKIMRIAVTSQNRKSITSHAGKCRKFWIYDIVNGEIAGRDLLELPIEQSLHASHGAGEHPLNSVDVLIAGSMGNGLFNRLKAQGIQPMITLEQDPDLSVAKLLLGNLQQCPAGSGCDEHDHDHHHHDHEHAAADA